MPCGSSNSPEDVAKSNGETVGKAVKDLTSASNVSDIQTAIADLQSAYKDVSKNVKDKTGQLTRQINAASEETADQEFRQEVAHVESELGLLLAIPVKSAAMLADQPTAAAPIAGDGMDHPAVPVVAAMLRHNPDLYSGYIGRGDGSFLQVIATRGDARIIKAQAAPDGTATIVRTIVPGASGRIERWTFLDAAGAPLGRILLHPVRRPGAVHRQRHIGCAGDGPPAGRG